MNTSNRLLDHEKFLIFGAARSGLAAARLLKAHGKRVAIYDEAPAEKLVEARRQADEIGVPLCSEIRQIGFPNGWEVMVLSPGIPTSHPLVNLAEASGCLVRSEIEVGYLACPATVVAITGTNGKTTVTHLVAHLLRACGRPALVAGNVGRPLCDAVMDPEAARPRAVVVCEVSSFQLETIEHFAPHVACVTNITPDHLDRYGTMDRYIEAKYGVTENQGEEDHLVLNGDDGMCRSFLPRTSAQVWEFSLERAVAHGAFVRGGRLFVARPEWDGPRDVMAREAIPLVGAHNVANVLSALCMTAALGAPLSDVARGVETFRAVPHRIEPVAEIDGVRYYNDSKATNLDSMEKALLSFDRPVILIAGGRDKGARWETFRSLVHDRVRTVVVIGECADKVAKAWDGAVADIRRAGDMAEAVSVCRSAARGGDVVLLSPGCASFDMYKNYEERGEDFRKRVLGLKGVRR